MNRLGFEDQQKQGFTGQMLHSNMGLLSSMHLQLRARPSLSIIGCRCNSNDKKFHAIFDVFFRQFKNI